MPEDAKQPLLNGEDRREDLPSQVDIDVDALIDGDEARSQTRNSVADSHIDPERYDCDEHDHYSDRAPWLRAAVLGANDGLVSVASIMLGVGGGNAGKSTLILSGLSALVAGAMSMAAGEYISVSSQRDTEAADVEKERVEQAKGPAARARELDELVQIYMDRGLEYNLARQVAVALTKKDVIRTHARDELGIDLDEMSSPWQAALSSMICFTIGGLFPLIPPLVISNPTVRLYAVLVAATVALLLFGATGAWLGGAHKVRASLRVLVGGWLAMAITYGVGRLFGSSAA